MTQEQGIYKSEDCSKEMKGQDFFVIFTCILILQGQGSVYAPWKNFKFARVSEIMFLFPLTNLVFQRHMTT